MIHLFFRGLCVRLFLGSEAHIKRQDFPNMSKLVISLQLPNALKGRQSKDDGTICY